MGDVGDFGKYGLLRALCAEELTWGSRTYDLTLGVVWYLVSDEEGTADGGHVGWLRQDTRTMQQFMPCDPELYHILLRLIQDGDRSVRAVRERGVLPEGTVFYEERLSFAGMPGVWITAARGWRALWRPWRAATSCSPIRTTAWSPGRVCRASG